MGDVDNIDEGTATKIKEEINYVERFKETHLVRYNTALYFNFPLTIYSKYFQKVRNPIIEPAFKEIFMQVRAMPLQTVDHLDTLINLWNSCSAKARDTEFTKNLNSPFPVINFINIPISRVLLCSFTSPAAEKAAYGNDDFFLLIELIRVTDMHLTPLLQIHLLISRKLMLPLSRTTKTPRIRNSTALTPVIKLTNVQLVWLSSFHQSVSIWP